MTAEGARENGLPERHSFWERSFERLDDYLLHQRLQEQRQKLHSGIQLVKDRGPLLRLLAEVDGALDRMQAGTYGICDVCHDPIEKDRLLTDPLIRTCLDHLTPAERRALQEDLDMAWRIQRELLPEREVRWNGWDVSYHYEPAGPVSGDYCDLLKTGSGDLYFLFGDVSGKGIAASMLMSHLHAMFRSLVDAGLQFPQLMDRANRLFCESTSSGVFATLVIGRASNSGKVQICNAGHCPPLWVRNGGIENLEATGIPLGIFCSSTYDLKSIEMEPGESLVLYTDGLTEARDSSSQEYGTDRIVGLMRTGQLESSRATINSCLEDLSAFLSGNPKQDDLTLMAIRRSADWHNPAMP
jgi:sigma-B regulation protein RsbU (phosphoserine phosphatase)